MAFKLPAVLGKRLNKFVLGIFFCGIFICILRGTYDDNEEMELIVRDLKKDHQRNTHLSAVYKFYKNRKKWTTSKLGSRLFKGDFLEEITSPQKKTFTVLVWKYWDWLKKRHVYSFGSSGNDPLEFCSVKNCVFYGEDDVLETADAVMVHLQHGLIPQVEYRPRHQRWIFLTDESPFNTFSLSNRNVSLTELANVFNWSMTYRVDSDVPVPYGRTLPLRKPLLQAQYESFSEIIPHWKNKRRDVLVAILISQCTTKYRMDFIRILQKYISVDVYGRCSNNLSQRYSCPGHFRLGCKILTNYLFYLVLENSSCREYITEKIWHHAYKNGAIPIIMGPSEIDCENLLPPNSYIYVPIPDFDNPSEIENLAKNLVRISEDKELLLSLHYWRNHFKIVNEHGFFGTRSYHLCRLCEALNYNDKKEKIYSEQDLRWFLDDTLLCSAT